MVRVIKGNLIDLAKQGHFEVIIHGCNCFCTMGSGVAKEISKNFPEAREADLKTTPGDKDKLGTITYVTLPKLIVVNAYTQFGFGGKNGPDIDYHALRYALRSAFETFPPNFRFGLPKIGAGLAGGSWSIIKRIIEEEAAIQENIVTIVEL